MAQGISNWWGMMRWWHWPGPSSGVPNYWDPPRILCTAVQDLHMCLESLVESDDLLDASHVGGCEGGACDFPNPYRGGHATGWETRASGGVGNCPTYLQPTWEGFWAQGSHQFRGDGRCAELVTNNTTRINRAASHQIRTTPLEDADSLDGIPQGAQLDLTSLGSMQMIMTQNTLRGELEYCYNARVISRTSLHLTNLAQTGNLRTNDQVNYS